jgi:hypothetical protein
MMPYNRCWSSLQLTGHPDFWHRTGLRAILVEEINIAAARMGASGSIRRFQVLVTARPNASGLAEPDPELLRSSRLGLTWAYEGWAEGCPQVKRVLPTFCGGRGSGLGVARTVWYRVAWLAVPAGVVLGDVEAEGFEFGDELAPAS